MIDLSMALTPADVEAWKTAPEDEHLEFKSAENNFDSRELAKYLCALANEGGGRIVLGMTNDRPRRVIGSLAFAVIDRTRSGLIRDLGIAVRADEIAHADIAPERLAGGARVLVFSVEGRRRGEPVAHNGAYLVRRGEDLVPMSPNQLRAIFAELAPDFSAQVCLGATQDDLDSQAIETLRALWLGKSGNAQLGALSPVQLLRDAELLEGEAPTYAALILLGSRAALTRFLPQAEVIWEFRTLEAAVAFEAREEYRTGFLTSGAGLIFGVTAVKSLSDQTKGVSNRDRSRFYRGSVCACG